MGGFGALRLGAANGDRVAAAAGLSSITHVTQMDRFGASLADRGVLPGQEAVIDTVLAHRRSLPRLHLDCGTDDLLISHNRELHQQLNESHVDHEWVEHEGRHEWAYWERHLPAALRFVRNALEG
jgi:S-formylglutathione hydrolase FrmB